VKADRKFSLTDPNRPVVNREALNEINTLNDHAVFGLSDVSDADRTPSALGRKMPP
jgi:hypothetical protein